MKRPPSVYTKIKGVPAVIYGIFLWHQMATNRWLLGRYNINNAWNYNGGNGNLNNNNVNNKNRAQAVANLFMCILYG